MTTFKAVYYNLQKKVKIGKLSLIGSKKANLILRSYKMC